MQLPPQWLSQLSAAQSTASTQLAINDSAVHSAIDQRDVARFNQHSLVAQSLAYSVGSIGADQRCLDTARRMWVSLAFLFLSM